MTEMPWGVIGAKCTCFRVWVFISWGWKICVSPSSLGLMFSPSPDYWGWRRGILPPRVIGDDAGAYSPPPIIGDEAGAYSPPQLLGMKQGHTPPPESNAWIICLSIFFNQKPGCQLAHAWMLASGPLSSGIAYSRDLLSTLCTVIWAQVMPTRCCC